WYVLFLFGRSSPVPARQGAVFVGAASQMPGRWYEGITRYQWLVLVIASLGWVFDVFEGQVFVATEKEAMPELLGGAAQQADFHTHVALGAFLLGGAAGGVLFGTLRDRKSTRLNSSHVSISYAVFCLKKKKIC